MTYRYTSADNTAITDGNGLFIPCDPANRDYSELLESGVEIAPYVPPPAAVPQSITPRQVRLLLLQQGLLAQVERMISQQDEATKITWEYAVEFRRDDPLLNALATGLGLGGAEIDQFFIAASAL